MERLAWAAAFGLCLSAACLYVFLPSLPALWQCVRAAWGLRGQRVYVALNRNAMQRYGDTMVGPCSSVKAATIGALWVGEWVRGGAEIMPEAKALAILAQNPYEPTVSTSSYYGLTAPAVVTDLRIVR